MIADVFGDCYAYPNITQSTHSAPEITQAITEVQPKPTVTHKVEIPVPKQSVKRKTECEKQTAKKVKSLPKKQTKTKQTAKKKPTVKRSRKPAVYKAKVIRESSEEEQFNSEEEQFYSDNKQRDLMNEVNSLAKQGYFAGQSRSGFSYIPSHE